MAFDLTTAKPASSTSGSGKFDLSTAKPAREVNPGMDPAPSGPDGVFSKDRVQAAWGKAKDITRASLSKMPILGGVSEDQLKQTQEVMTDVIQRPLNALTAVAVDTPFADPNVGVWDTLKEGFLYPEKYPPEEMTTALMDAGMEPYTAASWVTLSQFGYYMGTGKAFSKIMNKVDARSVKSMMQSMEYTLNEAPSAPKVKLNPELVKNINKNVAQRTILELYAKSRGYTLAGDGAKMVDPKLAAEVSKVGLQGVQRAGESINKRLGKFMDIQKTGATPETFAEKLPGAKAMRLRAEGRKLDTMIDFLERKGASSLIESDATLSGIKGEKMVMDAAKTVYKALTKNSFANSIYKAVEVEGRTVSTEAVKKFADMTLKLDKMFTSGTKIPADLLVKYATVANELGLAVGGQRKAGAPVVGEDGKPITVESNLDGGRVEIYENDILAVKAFVETKGEVPFEFESTREDVGKVRIHKSAKKPGEWQITYFDNEDQPVGDVNLPDYDSALSYGQGIYGADVLGALASKDQAPVEDTQDFLGGSLTEQELVREHLADMDAELAGSQLGSQGVGENEVTGEKFPVGGDQLFPNFWRTGWDREYVRNVIGKGLEGEKMTPKEKAIWEELQAEAQSRYQKDPEKYQEYKEQVQEQAPAAVDPLQQAMDEQKAEQNLTAPVTMDEAVEALRKIDPMRRRVGNDALITPAEYLLKQLGLDEYIGSPLRRAIQDTNIELGEKLEEVIQLRKEYLDKVPLLEQDKFKETVWNYLDKGIPEGNTAEIKLAKKFREYTEDMIKRINETNRFAGLPEVKNLKDYVMHMVRPEILDEMLKTGEIPKGFNKVIKPGVTTTMFLRTAQERKGMPDEYLVKDPFELMKAMFAIDIKYINLQRALAETKPYVDAVRFMSGSARSSNRKWDDSSATFVEKWIKYGVKRETMDVDLNSQANLDMLVDFTFGTVPNMFASTEDKGIMKAAKDATQKDFMEEARGKYKGKTEEELKALWQKAQTPEYSFKQITGLLSSAMQTGALGLRAKVAIRNSLQSTFDWVMYGTEPYLKAQALHGTKEGLDILKQSRFWKARMPIEGQDENSMNKFMRGGSWLYRKADIRNVGVGILTRYLYATDTLNMGHKEALDFADTDIPRTQWSYTREDLPAIYWSATGRTFATFGSWWMNFWTNMLPELVTKAWVGKSADGRVVTTQEKRGILRLIGLIAAAWIIRQQSKNMTGTAIDYTGVVSPMPFGQSPQAQIMLGAVEMTQGRMSGDERKWKEGQRKMFGALQLAIPYWLSIKETNELFKDNGTTLLDYLSYTDK